MRISRAKSTEEFGYLDSKNVPEPHVRQARPPYRAWEGWEIPDGGWEVPWAVVTCCKILLNIQKQRVLMGREITPDTLIKTLSGAALLYAITFIPRPMKSLVWCQASAELALVWHRLCYNQTHPQYKPRLMPTSPLDLFLPFHPHLWGYTNTIILTQFL